MKFVLAAAAAAVLVGAMPTVASATPAAQRAPIASESVVDHVQYKKRKWQRNRVYNRGYRAGRRDTRNWRRYNARPYNWRSRGCIVVGPVWLCP